MSGDVAHGREELIIHHDIVKVKKKKKKHTPTQHQSTGVAGCDRPRLRRPRAGPFLVLGLV